MQVSKTVNLSGCEPTHMFIKYLLCAVMGAVCFMCGYITTLTRNALSSKKQKIPMCRGLNLQRFVVMQ